MILAKANGFKLKLPLHELKPLCFVALFSITGWHLFSAHGVLRMNAGRAVIIAFTMPLWANILSALLLKERITSTRLLALGIGLGGLALLIWPELEAVGAAPLGAAFMLAAAVSWATGTVLIKRTDWNTPTTVLTGWAAYDRRDSALPLGMSMLVTKRKQLYGRYWGCPRSFNSLHFNACYYSPIEWAIDNGVQRFDPGAGGAHKIRRGFNAVPSFSLHRFSDPRLLQVMQNHIDEINRLEQEQIDALNSELPFAQQRLRN